MSLLVSICCATYNHEKYIRDALEGFIMQKTDFAFEVLIHDDASTDKTADIIREYEAKYPDIIKPIYQTKNQYSKGVKVSFIFNFPRAKGKYIALCEGDDYWIDPLKLQKQVDFMESRLDYSMCCHNAYLLFANHSRKHYRKCNEDKNYSLSGIVWSGGWFCSTASVLFRRELINNYPTFCSECYVGDYPLFIYLGTQGSIFYMKEAMSVYRMSSTGSWTSRRKSSSLDKKVNGICSLVEMLNSFDKFTEYKYSTIFQRQIRMLQVDILILEKRYDKLIEYKEDIEKMNTEKRYGIYLKSHRMEWLYSLYTLSRKVYRNTNWQILNKKR